MTAGATTGDVLARFQVTVEEVDTSFALLDDFCTRPGPPHAFGPDHVVSGVGSGSGIVEGWRGAIVHRIEVDGSGHLTRVKIVDPSFFNWPALSVALADTIVPDFPLANKSFNLSYVGNDL
jgi:Ni,Fe-hydrogenase III large subunit